MDLSNSILLNGFSENVSRSGSIGKVRSALLQSRNLHPLEEKKWKIWLPNEEDSWEVQSHNLNQNQLKLLLTNTYIASVLTVSCRILQREWQNRGVR